MAKHRQSCEICGARFAADDEAQRQCDTCRIHGRPTGPIGALAAIEELPPGALAAASTEELHAELARGLTLTAETLTRLGAVWAELERRGEDLSDLRSGLARTLPLIAAGRLSAEAVVAFAGRPLVLRALEGVPLGRQRELAAGGSVSVIDPSGTPEAIVEMPLARLPAAAVRLVFADGEVRTPAQQRLALRPRQRRREQADEDGFRYRPRYDRATGTIRIGRMTVRLDDLLAELTAAAGPELPALLHAEEYVTVRVRLSPEEHDRLQAAARKAELPDWELARKALRAFGLI